MNPEELANEIHRLDAICNERAGHDRLQKQARLIRLKAKLAGQHVSHIAQLDDETRDCLRADVRRATRDVPTDGESPDWAFERAVSTIEGLVATRH